MHLILASRSPRRQELLERGGFTFEVRPSQVEESRYPDEAPADFACRAAQEKALDVGGSCPSGSLVLGADTVVVAPGGELLGKPRDAGDARRMLRLLAGTTHQVITGLCLVRAPGEIVALKWATTAVTFRDLDEEDIQSYLASREPFDKAGAYGIQGLASRFVTRVEGCHFNVVGLPVALVDEILRPFVKTGDSPL